MPLAGYSTAAQRAAAKRAWKDRAKFVPDSGAKIHTIILMASAADAFWGASAVSYGFAFE